MQKKQILFKTKGMNRDLSVSAFNPEFSFENRNLRLSTNENNTLLSWVNEKGTRKMNSYTINVTPWLEIGDSGYKTEDTIKGRCIGTAVINDKLVLFTKSPLSTATDKYPDSIYVLNYTKDYNIFGERLFYGHLDFSFENPIETIVSYESDDIQKVYWVDGKNQPRIINIKASKEKIALWNKDQIDGTHNASIAFDFNPAITLSGSMEITRSNTSGMFAPGVIQYAFCYLNMYAQQSSIVGVSPLYYITHSDRGASPEESVSCSFDIVIKDTEESDAYNYIRLFSIQRTSVNAVPVVKHLTDIKIVKSEERIYELVHTDNPSYKLPIDTEENPNSKIYSVHTNDSKHTVVVQGKVLEFNPDDDIVIKTLIEGEWEEDITFQECINGVTTEPRYVEGRLFGEYYRGFKLSGRYGLYHYVLNNVEDVADVKLYVNNTEVSADSIVYDFNTQKWYAITGGVSEIIIEANKGLYYRDNGTGGSTIDSTALLFANNAPISAETIVDKDNTLFLGNVKELPLKTGDIQGYFDDIRDTPDEMKISFFAGGSKEFDLTDSTGTIYKNTFELKDSQWKISTFKGGEIYRFGFQLKDKNGVWTNPIFMNDEINSLYPKVEKDSSNIYSCSLVGAKATINLDFLDEEHLNLKNEYTEIRPVIVHPTPADRRVLYQGVLCPTVFQASNRYKNDAAGLKAQSSWFFRPMTSIQETSEDTEHFVTFKHYESLPDYTGNAASADDWKASTKAEIYGAENSFKDAYDIESAPDVDNVNTQFFVDQSIVTLNSPDIELGEDVQSNLPEGLKLRVVGAVPITANASYTYLETSSKETAISKRLDPNYVLNNIDTNGGQRLVAGYLWEDSLLQNVWWRAEGTWAEHYRKDDPQYGYNIDIEEGGNFSLNSRKTKFVVNPWHATKSLNNDWLYGSTILKKKIITTQLFSHFSEYFQAKEYQNISSALYSSVNRTNTILPSQSPTTGQKSYTGYLDTVILNNNGLKPRIDCKMRDGEPHGFNFVEIGLPESRVEVARQAWGYCGSRGNNLVPVKYNSASHAVIAFNADSEGNIPILPRCNDINKFQNPSATITFWGENVVFSQEDVNAGSCEFPNYAFLWLGELYREDTNEFGGKTIEALKTNTWLTGGPTENIEGKNEIEIQWLNGDTFFQRYDCLKTVPLTDEDVNQNTEILSFMCETRINLDGRYDKFRGVDRSMLALIDSVNSNKINPAYSQEDNYFTQRVYEKEDVNSQSYPNYIAYSLTKTPGSDVDTYTDISLASVLELDGDKGEITALRKLNNHIFAFQDRGISRVMFNDNVQIQSTEGVPIQIANSGKVLGKDYISNSIGCSNKWSIVHTPNGLYFMDSNDKSIYLFNGQLENVSTKGGFSTWCKQNIPMPSLKWIPAFPEDTESKSAFRGVYDKQNQEVLYINKGTALAFSEKLGAFTSFYNYEDSPFLENIQDIGLWIKNNDNDTVSLWRHQDGDYCRFFGTNKPYSMTLVGNPEPQIDKIFTNLEFRASVEGEGSDVADSYEPYIPFKYLETWNEYQHGIANLSYSKHSVNHHSLNNNSFLSRKFRIWRCDIPRDNHEVSQEEAEKGIYRNDVHPNDRMRNPWLYLKLQQNVPQDTKEAMNKVEIHDVVMTYFE